MDDDKYMCLKIPLNKIIKDCTNKLVLKSTIFRTNLLTIHAYQFLRLWYLHKYETNQDIPIITKDIIKTVFNVLSTYTRGPKNKNQIVSELTEFYDKVYSCLGNKTVKKINGTNLSSILSYQATGMLTCIENNIKLRFVNYLHYFINSVHKYDEKNGSTKKIHKQELFKVKQDFINGTQLCNEKYHNWLTYYRTKLLPIIEPTITYQDDINNNPQKYLKYMLFMNIELEKLGLRLFQFFPQRTSFIQKYISVDTKALIELFITDKIPFLSDINGRKQEVWNKCFKTDMKIFNTPNHTFDYTIMTDGMYVSIRLIHNKYIDKMQTKKSNMSNALRQTRQITKNMTNEEKNKYNEEKKEKQKQNAKDKQKKNSEQKKAYKLRIKQMPKYEKELFDKQTRRNKEFIKITDLNNDEIDELKKRNKVYIDPGKNTLLQMMDDKKIYYRYTRKQRAFELKQKKYSLLLNNYKTKHRIKNYETLLSKSVGNSRSCMYTKYKAYLEARQVILHELLMKYLDGRFRQYRWYQFINKQKSESKLMNNICTKYSDNRGNKPIIIIGDWNGNNYLKHNKSTSGIGLKRKLVEQFTTYEINEHNTSKICYKTGVKCKNLYLSHNQCKPTEKSKIHTVLTYTMSNGRTGCINRDKNGVNNFKIITESWINSRTIPSEYHQQANNRTRKEPSGRVNGTVNNEQADSGTIMQPKIKQKLGTREKSINSTEINPIISPIIQQPIKETFKKNRQNRVLCKSQSPTKVQNKTEKP